MPFIGFPSHHIPKRTKKRKIQNPNSKIQIKKRRSVSAQHVSAQQLRPQKLKHLNPLLTFILLKKLGCSPHIFFIFFLSSKLRCFTWNFGSWPVSPKNQDNFLFLQIHQHSEQNVTLEITKKVQSLAHKQFASQKSGTTKKNGWEKFCESSP